MEYFDAFSDLRGVYLEDSWVLAVDPNDDGVAFRSRASSIATGWGG
jgi:hypothetical protein